MRKCARRRVRSPMRSGDVQGTCAGGAERALFVFAFVFCFCPPSHPWEGGSGRPLSALCVLASFPVPLSARSAKNRRDVGEGITQHPECRKEAPVVTCD